MPFDVPTTVRLADVASWVGVTPVPLEVLAKHKDAEIRKRPAAHWLYGHKHLAHALINTGGILSMMTALGCAVLALFSHPTMKALGFSLVAVIAGYIFYRLLKSDAFTMQGMRLNGPALWSEYTGELSEFDIPKPIHKIAKRVMARDCTIEVVFGVLQQNYMIVDPYLVLTRGDDRICIGIWDEHGEIVHMADLA